VATDIARRSSVVGSSLQRLSILICWALIIVIFGALEPDTFLTSSTFSTILGSQAVLALLTLGVLVAIRAGEYDLSVASNLTLASMLVAVLNVVHSVDIWLAVLIALGAGAVVGAVNGFLCVRLGMDSFIATLGVGTFVQGITLWVGKSTSYTGTDPALTDLTVGYSLLGIPIQFYYALALSVVLWYVFEYTGVGRRQLFVGKNRDVARLSGIAVGRVRFGSFVVAGLISAGAGVIYTGTAGGADPTSGLSFLLPAFAATFLGATTIVPGQFNPWGAFISVYFLVTGITALAILGVPTYVNDLFYGGALVIAVAFALLARREVSRSGQRRRVRRVPTADARAEA
jgi:ribose transport system permease protein